MGRLTSERESKREIITDENVYMRHTCVSSQVKVVYRRSISQAAQRAYFTVVCRVSNCHRLSISKKVGFVKMIHPLQKYVDYYRWVLSLSDERVSKWLFMKDPTPSMLIILLYVTFCYIAPRVLKGRSFEITSYVRVYNLAMVFYSLYMAYELYRNTLGYYYWPCEPLDRSMSPRSMAIAGAMWHYYISKIIEVLDSIFFTLRGKYNQLTCLHIYHHSTMIMMGWTMANFAPGGNSVFGAALNCDIHILMYSYYFLATFGPKMQRYLWWKKYLTRLQIMQFLINLAFVFNFLRDPTQCEWSQEFAFVLTILMISYLIMFINFYIQTYYMKLSGWKAKKEP